MENDIVPVQINPAPEASHKMVGRAEITESLFRLGIRSGDVLYIRAALGSIGKISGEMFDSVVGGFLDAVGEKGTIVVPAFTKIAHIFSSNKTIFDSHTVPYSGAISKLFLKHPKVVRSTHPSHSFAGVGPHAAQLLGSHGPRSSCFEPIKRLAEMDGKMLLLGCNNDSPGFSTVHVAQYELGLTQRHLAHRLQRAWIKEGDRTVLWRPHESPGCSASFDKFYPAYIRTENLFAGYVGKAYTLYVPSTRRALEADLEILRDNPTFVDCGRASCLTCGLRSYQPLRIPITLVAAAWQRLGPA
jgi:aminoglycoside 3-N-acetyltransferase